MGEKGVRATFSLEVDGYIKNKPFQPFFFA